MESKFKTLRTNISIIIQKLAAIQKLKIYEFIKIFHSQIFTLYSNNVDNKLYTVMMRTSQLVSTD